jgi:hypothetical protein
MCSGLSIHEGALLHEFICGAIQNTFCLHNVPGKIVTPLMTSGEM